MEGENDGKGDNTAQYLIEFRFQSKKAKDYLKEMASKINRKFRVGRKRHIPHISLVGPIETNEENRLLSDFVGICSVTKVMKFTVNGFGTFDNKRVVFVDIKASHTLNDFRNNLVNGLKKYCKLQPHDLRAEKEGFGYHSTLAMKLDQWDFEAIKQYINSKPKPEFKQIIMRVTLLKEGRILRDYDFMQRKALTRTEALDKAAVRHSKELLRRFMNGEYNPDIKATVPSTAEMNTPKNASFWDKIKSVFKI